MKIWELNCYETSLNNGHVILQRPIAYFSQNPLSPKKNDDGQKNTEKEGKQTLKGIPFEVCFFGKNGQKPCKINAFEKCICNALDFVKWQKGTVRI